MNPNKFIEWADELAHGNETPAAMRSAGSRAYYGAFHLAKDFLAKLGFYPPKGDNEHQAVHRHFAHCTHADAMQAGGLLRNLHEERKEADYQLAKPRSESAVFAKDCVARAKLIREKLLACADAAAITTVKAEILDYRKKVKLS